MKPSSWEYMYDHVGIKFYLRDRATGSAILSVRDGLVPMPVEAKMIGAAPEMAEAIEWALPKIHQAYHEGELQECNKPTCVELRNALEKARGK